MEADWAPAMDLWKEHMRALRPGRFDEDAKPKFRGSCVRDGRHAYKSVAIAEEIGGDIHTQWHWPVDLSHFDLEVVCILLYQYAVVGISLADPEKIQYRNRMAAEDRTAVMNDSKYVSTLRPSTTYLMLQLAQYELGDVLLDSMCGVGTIPICCAGFTHDQIFALGGELESLPVEKAGQNAISSRPRNVDVLQWDSTCLPLRSESVDKVIIDLPFGVNCGSARQLSKVRDLILVPLFHHNVVGSTDWVCKTTGADVSQDHEGAVQSHAAHEPRRTADDAEKDVQARRRARALDGRGDVRRQHWRSPR
jgi:tRNA G10  N-methylase Trm11